MWPVHPAWVCGEPEFRLVEHEARARCVVVCHTTPEELLIESNHPPSGAGPPSKLGCCKQAGASVPCKPSRQTDLA